MQIENIPTELKQLSNWVARVDKIPVNPKTLYNAKANEPQSWGTFEQAVECIGKISKQGKPCNGVGFELKAPYCGIVIDHCFNSETGEISKEALDIIDIMDSYTEISPSGTGIHILYKNDGSTHPEWHKKKPIDSVQHLEMYQSDRYFTVTGNIFGGSFQLNERTKQANLIYKAYMQDRGKSETPKKQTSAQLPPLTNLPDIDIISKAMKSKNGSSFTALWRGDTSAYNGDESRADLALCNMLAFWCGGDTVAIDRLFRQSGLMRDKWNRRTSNSTYGEITIKNAVAECTEFYNPTEYKIKNTAARLSPEYKLPTFSYEDITKYKADDIGTAEFFAKLVKDFMCYVPEEKAFYIYNGVIWEKDVIKENLRAGKVLMQFVAIAQKLIPPKPDGQPKEWTPEETEAENINGAYRTQYKSLGNANGRERVIKDIKKLLYKSRNSFDTQPELLNCKNCTYNLDTGKTQPHTAADLLTKCVNADYDPTASNDRFDKFIDEICESDKECKIALQTALGYSLIGSTPEECFFIAYGKTTRNGKGTLFDLVLDVLGDYGLQMDFDTIARSGTKDASRATPDLARLVGIRYVLANEPQKGVCFNEGLLKQLTGSDDITARPLYGSVIEFKPTFKIFITANNLPAVSDDTLFTSDRIRILPFNKHFSAAERDTSLKATLRKGNGRAAVLNWLIEGYKIYRLCGFTETQQSKAILQQYRNDNDYMQEFINECLTLYPQEDIHAPKTKITEVQNEYNYWCRSSNIKPLGKRNFCEELEKHNVKIITHNKQKAIKAKVKDKYLINID